MGSTIADLIAEYDTPPEQEEATKTPKPDVGRELQRAARSIVWRSRAGLYPVGAVGGLWLGAAMLHDNGASPLYGLVLPAGAALLGVAAGRSRTWLGKALWRRMWASGCLAAAAAWSSTAIHVGAGMNTPAPTLLITAGGLLAAPWWWANRPKPWTPSAPPAQRQIEAATPMSAIEPPHPHQTAWREHAGSAGRALADSHLVCPEPIADHNGDPNGMAWIIDGGPRKHTYDKMRGALDSEIKPTLDRPHVDSLIYLEQDPEQYKTRGRLIVLDRNPLVQEVLWDGAQLDPATGLVPMAIYPDGSGWAYYVLYRPRWGTPHDLLAGCTGSGKSTALRLIMGESICAGSALMLFDPHGGGSFKEALPKVTRSFLDERGIYAGMRGLAAAQEERLQILREVGEDRMGPEFGHPILHAVIDEASKKTVLGNPDIGQIILAGVQEGRKLWMKFTLAMQRPSVGGAFDDNSDAREQLLAGNVVIYRVSTSQTSRMANQAGLDIQPHALPASFDVDGKIPTTGLGFVLGANRRELVSRTVNATQEAFVAHVPKAQQLDDRTAEAFQRGYEEAVADMERAAEDAEHTPGSSPAPVISINANDGRIRDEVLAGFRERGQLKVNDLTEICSMSHAYRVVEALEKEGHITKAPGVRGVYELRAS